MSMFSDEELKTVAEVVGRNTGKAFDLSDPQLRFVVGNEFLAIEDGAVIDRIQKELEARGVAVVDEGDSDRLISVPQDEAVTLSPEALASLGEGDEPTRGISTLVADKLKAHVRAKLTVSANLSTNAPPAKAHSDLKPANLLVLVDRHFSASMDTDAFLEGLRRFAHPAAVHHFVPRLLEMHPADLHADFALILSAGSSGADARALIVQVKERLSIPVAVVSDQESFSSGYEMLKAGAQAYLVAKTVERDFSEAMAAMYRGMSYMSHELEDQLHALLQNELVASSLGFAPSENVAKAQSLQEHLGAAVAALQKLSTTETEVLKLVAEGLDYSEIVKALRLGSEEFQRLHEAVESKLGLDSSIDVARVAGALFPAKALEALEASKKGVAS